MAISVTGLLLTFSSWLLEGRSYDFLAIAHMATVVLTLVFIPFGKFFHVIQRPAGVGVEIYKRSALGSDVFPCRRCGEPLEAKAFVADLKQTMDELELGFSRWAETCPPAASGSHARPGLPGHGQAASGERGPLPGGGPRVGDFRGAGGAEPAAHWKATAAEAAGPDPLLFCGVQCGMYLQVTEGRVIGVEPRNHDINKLRLCPKGMVAYQQVHHPDRLLSR